MTLSNRDTVGSVGELIYWCLPGYANVVNVYSLGALRRKVLPWIEYNPSVRYFRYALYALGSPT
jgi:hypothetical protein